MVLSDSDIRLINRAKKSESSKWGLFLLSLIPGIGFIVLFWQAPFAFYEFYHFTAVGHTEVDFREARYVIMWFVGLAFILRGISELCLSRERRLLIKLYENHSKDAAEQGAAANP